MQGISASDPISRSGRVADRDADRAPGRRRRKRAPREPAKPAGTDDEAPEAPAREGAEPGGAPTDAAEDESPTRGRLVDIEV